MEYICVDQAGKQQKEKWMGEIRLLEADGKSYEAEITGRGTYFYAIVDRHHYENFICIPNHDVRCEFSDYSYIFGSRERLSGQLKKVDAVTVACDLRHLKEL